MTAFERLKNLLLSLRRAGGIELPDDGRSSVESTLNARINGRLTTLGVERPEFAPELLPLLKKLWLINPDFSQYVSNLVNLANSGHQLSIGSDRQTESVVKRLNETAQRLYSLGGGVDGLINSYLSQIAWSGALSSEDVVNFAARRVDDVVIVPVEEIRFRYEDGFYQPYQQPRNALLTPQPQTNAPINLVKLNGNTYRYLKLQSIENSPYAKPPASAAAEMLIGVQADIFDNIKFIVKKLGILGLVSVMVAPPRQKPNETEQEFKGRAQRFLSSVREVLEKNFNRGLLVTYRDQKVEHSNVASDARGAYEVVRVVEEQIISALNSQPAFFGRTDSSTETYANVVYHLLTSQAHNYQRLCQRRHEATCRLDLLLAGISGNVSMVFNKIRERDPQKEAQARQIEQQMIFEKIEKGIISPDQGAQELGYDAAFDPELLTGLKDIAPVSGGGANARAQAAVFRFDRASQSYRYVPQLITLLGSDEAVGAGQRSLEKKN